MENTTRTTNVLLAVLLLAVGAAVRVEGQVLTSAELEGSYHLVPERSDDVAIVVDQWTSGRSWPVRALMRDRLKKTLRPAAELRIEAAGDQIEVTPRGEPPVRARLGEVGVPWSHSSGERMEVHARMVNGALVLVFEGRGATREEIYRLADGGRTLEVRVALSGERLGGDPISYSLRYARTGVGAGR